MVRLLAADGRLRRIKNGCLPVHSFMSKRIVFVIALFGSLVWQFLTLPIVVRNNDKLPQTSLETSVTAADVGLRHEKTGSNETSLILDDTMFSLDRIIDKKAGTREPPRCAPREGLIISNTMGRLANNLFEVGFANRLAKELCWSLLFRPHWQGEIPNPRATECFPHAMLPNDHASLTVPLEVQKKLQINSTFWKRVSKTKGNRQFQSWFAEREQEGVAVRVVNDASLFTGDGGTNSKRYSTSKPAKPGSVLYSR